MTTLGELREEYGWGAMRKMEQIAYANRHLDFPFYIIMGAKADPHLKGSIVNGQYCSGGLQEHWVVSNLRPPKVLGLLVWYVDNKLGKCELVEELSLPPDIPLDPSLLSDKSEDQFHGVMQQGKNNNVLVS
jgi:hypothetical protein